ncbi:multidrug effflux MFS transporter [Secundilactobacillus mixtipabuli]|uniref:Bcr/CflA family efflux transporter n=1 Tax=Secundilactobacillus mixtipabuli TaxID=1435342 RepID=A0A1Z5IE64_9LACO|nr:multidrug effflux MFS transporter [Secundilactobacillus mixtipabuli]GAX00013.1 major facilitator superfamily transporter [Secundilactobacillus mixtipabuli]
MSENRHRLRFILILGTLSATGPLSIDLYLPALPQMMRQFQTSPSLIQLSLTACLLGLAFGQLIAGPLSDHYGRKKPLLAGFLVFALASFLIALTHSVAMLIVMRFIQGLAGASGQVLSRAVARDLFSGHALTNFYAILNAVNGVFPIIAPIIGGFMIQFVPWEAVFILLGAIGLVLSGLIVIGIPETLKPENRLRGPIFATFKSFGKLVEMPGFMRNIMITGLIYGCLFSYISASTFIYQQLFHLSAQTFSLIYALNGLGIVIGSSLPSRINRLSEVSQMKIGMLIILLDSLMLLIGSWLRFSLMTVAVLLWVLVFFIGMLLTLTTSIIMNQTPQNAGSASALVGLSQNAFGGVSSPLVGLFGKASYAPMAGLLLLYSLSALGLSYKHRLKK